MNDQKVHFAVISMCEDLTMPGATTIPVAALSATRMGDELLLMLAVNPPSFEGKSPFLSEIVDTLPEALQLQVNEAVSGQVVSGPDEVIRLVTQAFQNTLFVSEYGCEVVKGAGVRDRDGVVDQGALTIQHFTVQILLDRLAVKPRHAQKTRRPFPDFHRWTSSAHGHQEDRPIELPA